MVDQTPSLPRVLIVEDNLEIRELLTDFLSTIFSVQGADSLKEARSLLSKPHDFKLILLDVLLPDGNGLDLCRELKNAPHPRKHPPIMILSGKSDLSDRIAAIESGADDFFSKPFYFEEVIAKARARVNFSTEERIQIPTDANLTPVETRIMESLNRRKDQEIVTREKLHQEVWNADPKVTFRSIDAAISKLRKKLRPYSLGIRSIYRQGYRFFTNEGG